MSPSFRACVSLACPPLTPCLLSYMSPNIAGCIRLAFVSFCLLRCVSQAWWLFFFLFVFLLFDFASSCVGWDGGLRAFVICVYDFGSPFWNLSAGLVVGVHPSLTLGTCYQLLLLGFKAWKLWLPVLHMKVCGTWVSCLTAIRSIWRSFKSMVIMCLQADSGCFVLKLTKNNVIHARVTIISCNINNKTQFCSTSSESMNLFVSILKSFVFSGGRVIPLQSFSIGTQIQEVGILKFASESWVPGFWQFWDFEITKIGLSWYTPEV